MWFLFADLSHFNWLLWRMLGYILYWIMCLFVPFMIVIAVANAFVAGVAMAAGFSFCLFLTYWLRRWLTGVTSIWPWMTPARQIRVRNATSANLTESKDGATLGRISIDGLVLLTGTVGLFCLLLFWGAAIIGPLLIAYIAYRGIVDNEGVLTPLVGSLIFALALSAICASSFWIARGFLEGIRHRAVVGCVLILIYIGWIVEDFVTGVFTWEQDFAFVPGDLVTLALLALLIVSFRNRQYWKR